LEYSVTSRLPVVMIDRPSPFDTLGTWQSFQAELEAMEDFQNKDIEIRTAKRSIGRLKKSSTQE
jgi:hypothetical protein